MTNLAIIGLGSWGLCALERVVTAARNETALNVSRVDLIEPGPPGSGVYTRYQPDYLIMNNPCGQLSLYPPAGSGGRPAYGLGLYEWALQVGYQWIGDSCVVTRSGRPITPHDFLPRRLMGEYLEWFYAALVAAANGVEIVHHATAAIDIRPGPAGRELVLLADGGSVLVDHVILTSGHTANTGPMATTRHLDPYPVQSYVDSLPVGTTVGVAGMGLVATDVVTALTVGRGGRFDGVGARLTYRPSGREPAIYLFSRSGLPYCAKAVAGVDATGSYCPAICTPDALHSLRSSGHRLDMRTDVLPLMFAEMQARFYGQHALLAGGPGDAAYVRRRVTSAWESRAFADELQTLATVYGDFDPTLHFYGPQVAEYTSSNDYESAMYDLAAADLDESLVPGGSSPVKCSYEVFRILRDATRSVVEFGGLTLESYVDFHQTIRNRVHRLVAGPPALRSQQLLALMDAGVVHLGLGPNPVVADGAAGFDIRSTALEQPVKVTVDRLVQAHIDDPTVHRSASPLLAKLYRSGRIRQFHYGEVPVGSIDLTTDFHPVDIHGDVQGNISVFGVLTEGIRYFNQYLPSPKSRARAVLDMQICLEGVGA